MAKAETIKKSDATLFGLFGAYLLVGAIYSFVTTSWFPGFPPQLDFSMLLGGHLGVYVEAILALVIGIICLHVAIRSYKYAT
jgi:xanthosine utilization system XapX-like protein